jgi:hypothetical protein
MLSSSQEDRQNAYPVDKTATIIKIDKNGFHVDGDLVVSNSAVTSLGNFYIGSAEGQTRSNATYEYIKIVKYV